MEFDMCVLHIGTLRSGLWRDLWDLRFVARSNEVCIFWEAAATIRYKLELKSVWCLEMISKNVSVFVLEPRPTSFSSFEKAYHQAG